MSNPLTKLGLAFFVFYLHNICLFQNSGLQNSLSEKEVETHLLLYLKLG